MKATFPMKITVDGIKGIFATVYKGTQTKGGVEYETFTLLYNLLGAVKRQGFADLASAIAAGRDAIGRIANGQQGILELANRDRDAYLRSKEFAAAAGVDIEAACRECADVRAILNGTGSPVEAARFFVKHHAKELPRITVREAVEKCLAQAASDGKSAVRMHELEHYLNTFADALVVEVGELTPGLVSRYLTGMTTSDRTKKNARDVIGYFGRWLVLHGYLARGTNLVEGVQRYSMKSGAIQIFSPTEISKLIQHADNRLLPYIVIGAFAGLRGAEILRLDWSEIDLADGFIEVKAEKAKTDVRRLVPIKDNLKAWLQPLAKKSGPVCSLKSIWNNFVELVDDINKALPKTPEKERMTWKKNGLRHSCISYRVAECADVARVADESGNSPAVIKSNYLKRVKPDQAKQWFAIAPAVEGKILQLAASGE